MWYVIMIVAVAVVSMFVAVVSWFVGVWSGTRYDEKRLDETVRAGTLVHRGKAYRVEEWKEDQT